MSDKKFTITVQTEAELREIEAYIAKQKELRAEVEKPLKQDIRGAAAPYDAVQAAMQRLAERAPQAAQAVTTSVQQITAASAQVAHTSTRTAAPLGPQ